MIFQNELIQSLQANGNHTAIEYDGDKISYSSLLSSADKVLRFLMNHSLGQETIIGIDLEVRPDLISSIIGVASARCVFVLLDRTLPVTRMDHMIKDMALDHVITTADRQEFYESKNLTNVWDYQEVMASQPVSSGSPIPEGQPDDSLYIYYTSGSTGVPKAIVGKNSSLIHFLRWEIEAFQIDSSFRFSQLISPYFDAFLRDVFVPLLSGATICIPPVAEDFFSEEKLISWIEGSRISLIHCVPSLFGVFNAEHLAKDNFSDLCYVLLSGEKIIPSDLTNWYDVFNDRVQLINLYGTTEATMISSCYRIQPQDARLSRMPIGSPIADTEFLVATHDMKPSHTLVPGELYIVTDYLTKGYLNAPELTNEKFITINAGTPDEKFAYKTGDQAVRLANGNIELIGREDRQVKIRGIRVELDEIESAIKKSDLQDKTVVSMVSDENGEESIVAYIVKKNPIQPDKIVKEALLEQLKKQLPAYMIPSEILLIDQIPLLSNGKTDYKALKKIQQTDHEIVLPSDQIEEKILGIWKDILGDKPISTTDSFHKIGGNSLTLMSLIARINKAFEIRISLSQIFRNSTVQKQAAFIKQAKNEVFETIPKANNAENYVLSSAQKRVFFLNEFNDNAVVYNMPQIVKLEGELDKARIESIFEQLIARHESLRTSFELLNGEPVQKIADQVSFDIEYFQSDNEQATAIIADFIRPFKLDDAPLLRIGIIEIAPNDHILMVDLHHIISDGVSNETLIKEFMALYNGDKLPELKLTYKDFATWQQSNEKQKQIAGQKDFWLKEYASGAEELMLPTDFARPAVKNYQGKSLRFELDKDTAVKLQAMAKAEGATMFMMLLSLYNILLSKLSNQEDIVVGSPTAGRHHNDAMENIIGMFVSTLPLRNYPKGDISFKDFLSDLKSKTLACFENQDYPFEDLVNDLNIERRTDRNPLFDVSFAFQNFKSSTFSLPGLALKPFESDQTVSKFDLSMIAYEKEDQLSFTLEYSTEIFKEATIQKFAAFFSTLAETVIKNPDRRISDLSLMTTSEVDQELYGYNADTTNYNQQKTFISSFYDQVRSNPDQPALVCEEAGYTYKQLDNKSNCITALLKNEGVQSGDVVGLMMDRTPDLVASILSIIKSGAAYLPIDPDYPEARKSYILEDSKARILLTSQALETANYKLKTLYVEDAPLDKVNFDGKDLSIVPSDLCYIIYTSGSTGHPKGAMIEHGALFNYINWASNCYLEGQQATFPLYSSISFDLTVTSIFLPLMTGNKIVIFDSKEQAALIEEVILSDQIDIIKMTPSHIKLLKAGDLLQRKSGKLKKIIVGGEALETSLAREIQETLGSDVDIYNEYGPTEATVGCMIHRYNGQEKSASVPIGHPINNTAIYILDKNLKPVPQGVHGEIYISGAGLAKGYINNVALTAERFIANPFVPGSKMYKTGDLACRLEDGNIIYKERADDQVKINGYRIELGELENAIKDFDEIRETVIAVNEKNGNKFLVAYYVSDEEIESDKLSNFLSKQLPAYMLPSFYVHLQSLPLTTNGKVDRSNLPDPGITADEHIELPSGLIESNLVDIWADVLDVKKEIIGVNRNFFELGGHSILAMKLISQIEKNFGVKVNLPDFFQSPNIKGVAQVIESGNQEIEVLPELKIDQDNRYEPFPMTDVQQAYWIGRKDIYDFGGIGTHGYSEIFTPKMDIERFGEVLNIMIDRHEMLRMVVTPDGEQRILKEVPRYDVPILDLNDYAEEEGKALFYEQRDEMSHQIFSGEEWPLFDIRVTAFKDGTYKIHYSMDTLIMDAGSSIILFDEFASIYLDETIKLPDLDISFRDYMQTEVQLRTSELFKKSKDYWLSRMDTMPLAPDLPLTPVDERPTKPVFKRQASNLESPLWNKLQAKAKAMGVTPTILMIGSFAEVLNRWSATSHFTLNLTLFNRIPFHENVDKLIGDFTSLTLLEADFRGSDDFSTRLKDLQQRLWQDLEYKFFSGVEVQRELSRKHGHTVTMPVVITSTLGLGDDSNTSDEEEDEIQNYDLDELQGKYSITQTPQVWIDFQFAESKDGLRFNWDCIEGLFPDGMIEAMFASYDNLLHGLVSDDTLWKSESLIPLPADQLKARNLVNATDAPESDKLMHELFTEQVNRSPEAVAIVARNKQLTYGELFGRSQTLGHQLRESGAKPNQLIAIVMDKGWEQVVASLGILYSGAAYLPIAADLPQSRIALLLEQGEADIVVTTPSVSDRLQFPEDKEIMLIDDKLAEPVTVQDITPVQQKEDLAYVIFTSGSTGMPKGVMIDHRGAVNTILDINSRFDITDEDSVLALSNLSFDLSVYDIFGLLAAGGTIVIPQQDEIKSPDKWIEYIQSHNVTVWNTVPALMQMLADFAEDLQLHLPLRNVLMSGDWIPVSLPGKIRKLSPMTKIYSLGGATEVSIWSIFYPIQQVGENWQSIPYGKPLTNQQFHVLKPDMTPCPDFIAGDLYIGGTGLAKGYWKDKEKTDASFVTHPATGERLYKTGDIGRYLGDGNIEFLGREDNQVKIQGYRIELGEIEEALKTHEQIQNAAVIATELDGKDKSLVAYVVGKGEKEQSGDSVGANVEAMDKTISDPLERKLFKMEGHGIREFDQTVDQVQLTHTAINGKVSLAQKEQKDFEFANESMKLEDFSGMLEGLKQNQHEDLILPKYYYPSAGSSYPVQTYVHIHDNSVEGVQEGYYYYNPKLHSLELINRATEDDKPGEFAGSVSLYLVADMNAIEPLYGSLSEEFCFSEAGYMTNLLINHYPEHLSWKLDDKQIAKDQLVNNFKLGGEHLVMQRFAGGVVKNGTSKKNPYSPLNEAGVNGTIDQVTQEIPLVEQITDSSISSLARKSYRTFSTGIIPMDTLANALHSALIQSSSPVFKGHDLNLYLIVKERSVEGLEEGYYYVDPVDQHITRICNNELNTSVFEGNEWIYDRAGFGIVLTGKKTQRSSFISGYIGQNMMNFNIDNLVGFCAIGTVNQAIVKEKLMLPDGEEVIQSWLGGTVEAHQLEATEQYMEDIKNIGAEDKLKKFLQERLPHYMIPSHFVPIESVPLSSNGKLDKKALPAIEIESKSEYQAAASDQEKILADIWAELLDMAPEKIGVNANFFELGGNSIKIIALHKRIKERFDYEIRVQDLFDNQTISECLDVINSGTDKLQDEDNEELKVIDF